MCKNTINQDINIKLNIQVLFYQIKLISYLFTKLIKIAFKMNFTL